jgi:ATP-dependent DNA helicase RecQ
MLTEAGDSGAYPTVRLTPLGWEVLRGHQRVEVVRAREAPRPPRRRGEEEMDGPARDLFERLRVIRRELAEDAQVPAYVIFTDASLRAMASRRPETRAQFAQIPGVGANKVAQFAGAFLAEIRAFCEERGLAGWPEGESGAAAPSAHAVRPPRATPAQNAASGGKLASARQTLDLLRAGLSLEEIAQQRGLARTTLVGHLCDLMSAGERVDVAQLIPAERLRRILAAFDQFGVTPLSPVKEALGEEVSYDDLRLARAALSGPVRE